MRCHPLIEALGLVKNEFYTMIGEKSISIPERAEELLGFPFSVQYRTFLKNVGYLSFGGVQIDGICNDDFSGTYVGCAVEAALSDRKSYNFHLMASTLLFDDGAMGAIINVTEVLNLR